MDRAHAHLRDDVRALQKPKTAAAGRSWRGAYRDPLAVAAELWIAVFWRNFGPRSVPRFRLKDGEEPRRSPAFSMGLARKNAPRKPNIAKLVWDFRLGLKEAEMMSKWLQDEVASPPYGLASLFTDFSLLGDLLARRGDEWARFLRTHGANLDHVETSDLRPGDLYGQMANDAHQLCWRLKLVRRNDTTEAGRIIEKIGAQPAESRSLDDSRVIGETLAAQIQKHYRGYKQISISDLLQSAARRVARLPGNWIGYCPGLLLGELRYLIPLAYEAPVKD